MPVKIEKHKFGDGKFAVDITCQKCGGPITHSDKYGMWCDEECDRELSVKGFNDFKGEMDSLINGFTKLIEGRSDDA